LKHKLRHGERHSVYVEQGVMSGFSNLACVTNFFAAFAGGRVNV